MFAQVIETAAGRAGRADVVRIVRDELVPALCREDGFSGAVGMVEAGTGRALMVAFWEHEAQAAPRARRAGHRPRRAGGASRSGRRGP